MKVYHQSRGIS